MVDVLWSSASDRLPKKKNEKRDKQIHKYSRSVPCTFLLYMTLKTKRWSIHFWRLSSVQSYDWV